MLLMSSRKVILASAATIMLWSTRVFSAILATDLNAMAGFHGTTDFTSNVGTLFLRAEVDYAVYEPGKFQLTFGPGSDPSNGTQYLYAYELHNTGTVGNSSDRDPDFLSVGFHGD